VDRQVAASATRAGQASRRRTISTGYRPRRQWPQRSHRPVRRPAGCGFRTLIGISAAHRDRARHIRSRRLILPEDLSKKEAERIATFGPEYQDHGVLFCWPDGRPPHPDTITRRFKKLAAAAGLPEIDLHDVRHSYATAGRDAKIDWKVLSHRIGHSDVAFTMKQYVQTDLEADRQVANTLAELIIGGSLASITVASLANPLANYMQKALSLFEKEPLALVAGTGFEPATSGL
jgi:hypothetical protein